MNKALLLLLCLSIAFGAKILEHKCAHNDIFENINNEIIDFKATDDDDEPPRKLQNSTPRNIQISYDMSYFNKLPQTPESAVFRNNCEKAVKIAIQYFTDLLTIVPKPAGAMIWNLPNPKCAFVPIPDADKTQDKSSDLHLYISFTEEPTKQFLAYAGWCRFLKVLGPTHGLVNFNLGLLKNFSFANPVVFDDLVEIVIHEITHVLGFSGNDIKYWVNSQKQPHTNPASIETIRGLPTPVVKTPNVLAHAKSYYGCETIPGMPLENQGAQGSAGSHWETTVINNELMNAALGNTQAYFTKFTTALLRDTGFYASVNAALEENSFYGKDEGCGFLTGACDSNKREFCKAGAQNQCDYHHYGTSVCTNSTFTDSGCNNHFVYNNGKCFDGNGNFMNNPTYVQKFGLTFGTSSRCFMSTLSDPTVSVNQPTGFCYQFTCNQANQVIVKVGPHNLVCSQNKQVLTAPGWKGQMTCPEKLDEFCQYKQFCPNYCSTNGYCVKGVCKCIVGFKGADCSQTA